jgi:hypothetical protein
MKKEPKRTGSKRNPRKRVVSVSSTVNLAKEKDPIPPAPFPKWPGQTSVGIPRVR